MEGTVRGKGGEREKGKKVGLREGTESMKYKSSTNNRQQKETNSLMCLLSPFPLTQLVLRRNKHSLSKMVS